MNIPQTTTPEFSKITCCICEQPIEPGWYASYSDTRKAHSECFNLNRSAGHSIRTKESKFSFYQEEKDLFIGGSEPIPTF